MPTEKKSWKELRRAQRKNFEQQIDKNLPRRDRRALAREMEKQLRRDAKDVANLLRRSHQGGVGLLADQILREFLTEFNSRLMKLGPEYQPSSFNVLRSFFQFESQYSIFLLKTEKDHLFSFSDFIDFATSPDCSIDPLDYAGLLENEAVYSYTNYEPPNDTTISTDPENDFGIGAISMIRCGSEVTVLLTAGRIADFEDLLDEEEKIPADAFQASPGKEQIKSHPGYQHGPEPLTGKEGLHKTLAAVRFNTRNGTREVQYVLVDWGDTYRIVTDDPIPLVALKDEVRNRTHRSLMNRLKPYEVLLELCSTVLALPHYFRFKVDLVRQEGAGVPQQSLLATSDSKHQPERVSKALPSTELKLRRVSALRILHPARRRAIRRYSPPVYQVEVSGFWRTLAPDASGKDPQGLPTQGRTWVKGHLRWRDRPAKPHEVLVKSRVAIARAIAESERDQVAGTAPMTALTEARTTDPTNATGSVGETTTEGATVSREASYLERRKLTKRLRWRVLRRDDFRCTLCGADAALDHSVRLEVDHVVPISRGGKTESKNLTTLCSKCNSGKGSELP